MLAEVRLSLEAATLKKLLKGIAELEGVLPYNLDSCQLAVVDIDLNLCSGSYEVYAIRMDDTSEIQCIKTVRMLTGDGLREAKAAVENLLSTGEPILIGRCPTKVEAIQMEHDVLATSEILETRLKAVGTCPASEYTPADAS